MTKKSIDHTVILVEDLEAGREAYLRLGFNVRPVAKHIEFGSSNAVIMFPATYLELCFVSEAIEPLRTPYVDRFKAGPGIAHVSLDGDGLGAERERLVALGFEPGPEGNARRKVILPDGSVGETNSSFLYNWTSPRRYLSLFFTEHRIPEMIFVEGHTSHANGATGTAGIVAVSEAPELDLGYYQSSYGHTAEKVDRDGFLMRGRRGDRFEVLTPSAAAERYAPLLDSLDLKGLGGFPVALHLTCKDQSATRAYLADAGFEVFDIGSGIAVRPDVAEGTILVFE